MSSEKNESQNRDKVKMWTLVGAGVAVLIIEIILFIVLFGDVPVFNIGWVTRKAIVIMALPALLFVLAARYDHSSDPANKRAREQKRVTKYLKSKGFAPELTFEYAGSCGGYDYYLLSAPNQEGYPQYVKLQEGDVVGITPDRDGSLAARLSSN